MDDPQRPAAHVSGHRRASAARAAASQDRAPAAPGHADTRASVAQAPAAGRNKTRGGGHHINRTFLHGRKRTFLLWLDMFDLLCSAHPKAVPGRIVRIFKSLTAREIVRRKPAVKRALWDGEFWTDGYYVATVGERATGQTIERYGQRQGQPEEDLRQLRMF